MTRSSIARIPVQDGPTITGLGASWYTDLSARARSARTIENYRDTLVQFEAYLASVGRPIEVLAVTREDVRAFVNYLLGERGLTTTTASTRFTALRAYFNWALDEGEISASPMTGMRAPTRREVLPDVLTDEQVLRLFRTCSGAGFQQRRDLAILRLLFDTGMRRNECGTLRVEDVDVTSRLATVLGKGNRVRRVAFGAKTAQALDRYLRVRRSHPYAAHQAFWLSQMGDMDGRSIAAIVKERGRQAGVRVHPHQFRHTYADRQLRAGMEEGDLMRQAGWKSSVMLRRYGAQLADDRSRDAYHRIGAPGDRL